jgi:hypothetical protein
VVTAAVTWAARARRTGAFVVKLRHGDRAAEKTQWCAAAGPLCARLRRWLEPVWGLRLPAVDYAHNDLNLIIGGLAVYTHERQAYGDSLGDEECAAESAILDRLQAGGSA